MDEGTRERERERELDEEEVEAIRCRLLDARSDRFLPGSMSCHAIAFCIEHPAAAAVDAEREDCADDTVS